MRHVERMRDPRQHYAEHLTSDGATDVVNPQKLGAALGSQVCGRCHSVWRFASNEVYSRFLKDGLGFEPGEELSSRGIMVIRSHALDPGAFWPDDEVKPSGREYNALLSSPCFRGGDFGCTSCHALHGPGDAAALEDWRDDQLRPGMRGNPACLRCHDSFAPAQALVAHTNHAADSPGSECQNCHMPYTNLGLRKAIRSHTITSPSAQTDRDTGRPNACNGCHLDQPLGFAARALADWYGQPMPELDDIERTVPASVVDLLSGDAAQRALAASALGWAPAVEISDAASWAPPLLSVLLRDPYDAVRYHAKRSLARIPGYEDAEYDWVAPASEREAQSGRITRRWLERRRAMGLRGKLGFLLTPASEGGADLTEAVFDRLAEQRDESPISIRE